MAPLPADDDLFIPPSPVFSRNLFGPRIFCGVDALMGKAEPKAPPGTEFYRLAGLCQEHGLSFRITPPSGALDWSCAISDSVDSVFVAVATTAEEAMSTAADRIESPSPEMRFSAASLEIGRLIKLMNRHMQGKNVPAESLAALAGAAHQLSSLFSEVMAGA